MFSVTEILNKYFDSKVSAETLETACERGHQVHKACEAVLNGMIPKINPEYQGYLNSFLLWYETVPLTIISTEKEYVNSIYGFYGHPDLVCTMGEDSRIVLADFKTSASESLLWKLQLAAYTHLLIKSGVNVERILALMLKQDGSFPAIKEYSSSCKADLAVFLSALNVHKFLQGRVS